MKIPLRPPLILLLAALAGCASPPLSYNDPSLPMDAIVGHEFQVSLEANHTTGYQWQVGELDAKVVSLVGTEYKQHGETLAGSGGAEVWTFRGVAPGKTQITFRYVRPWEKDAAPARSETFTVNVRQGD